MLRIVTLFVSSFIVTLLTAQTMYEEVSIETQIDHVASHSNFMGGGAAFVDINNDGYDDLYITSGNLTDKLYLNDQQGGFSDISDASGISAATTDVYTTGVIFGDIDNDGFRDLFVSTRNNSDGDIIPNLLLKNNGNLQFENVWTHDDHRAFSMGACFLDYDQDGLLDLYVINYVESIQFLYDADNNIIGFDHTCSANRFYKNMGNGVYEDLSIQLGLADDGCALAVKATDFDLDGDTDILLANDFGEFIQPNKLYENKLSSGKFTEVAEEWNADIGMYAMGIAAADIDLDGDFDYYLTNFGKNALMRKEENSFTDISVAAGVDDTWEVQDSILSVSWGTAFMDYDNNMYPDLYVSNGYVPGPDFIDSRINNNDRFYINNEDGTFDEVSPTLSGIDDTRVNRGMAFSDYDHDGDLDFVTISLRAPINDLGVRSKIYKNTLDNENNWIGITLEGVVSTRDAFGAVIKVFVGDHTLIAESYGGSSHCSQNSSTLHFGLDNFTTVDSIEIDWPSKVKNQKLFDIDANQILHIVEDENLISHTANNTFETKFEITPNPSTGTLNILFDFDFPTKEIESISVLDLLGNTVKTFQMDAFKTQLDVSSGIYILSIRLNTGAVINKRFVRL